MNITQAKTAMKHLLGTKALWRYDERAPTADERETIRESLPGLQSAAAAAREAMEARRVALLADPEYLRLRAEWKDADKTHSAAASRYHHHRVVIGKNTGMAMLVLAEGDNWHDAIDKLKASV